jgi:glycosyltransferase involved in cell wall biosynthesis
MNKTSTTLITVILPVFNVERYIKDAVLSILNQTIQDFEVLIIDDCSTDKTLSVIELIGDSRIKIIKKHKSKGLIDSLNIGFDLAEGKYIARMDGDDISVSTRFEKQLSILESDNNIKAVGCWLKTFGLYEKTIHHAEHHYQIQTALLDSNPMSLGSVMLCSESYKNFRFYQDKIHVEDYDFWAKSAWHCEMYNIQEVLYLYRVHVNQVSNQFKSIQVKGDIQIKLFLYKKTNYNVLEFSDQLITKILFTNENFTSKEFKLILKWFSSLVKINNELLIYDKNLFKDHMLKLKRNLIFLIFLTNFKKGVDFEDRKFFFLSLTTLDKIFVVKLKFKEKTKSIFKKNGIKK